jgi:hypothetical protein
MNLRTIPDQTLLIERSGTTKVQNRLMASGARPLLAGPCRLTHKVQWTTCCKLQWVVHLEQQAWQLATGQQLNHGFPVCSTNPIPPDMTLRHQTSKSKYVDMFSFILHTQPGAQKGIDACQHASNKKSPGSQ